MDNPQQFIRAQRSLTVCHGEAFQLMLYEAKYDQRESEEAFIAANADPQFDEEEA